MSLVTYFNWNLEQLDVKTTLLHGDLDETIFIQPEWFKVNKDGKEFVCLFKSLCMVLKSYQENDINILILLW